MPVRAWRFKSSHPHSRFEPVSWPERRHGSRRHRRAAFANLTSRGSLRRLAPANQEGRREKDEPERRDQHARRGFLRRENRVGDRGGECGDKDDEIEGAHVRPIGSVVVSLETLQTVSRKTTSAGKTTSQIASATTDKPATAVT